MKPGTLYRQGVAVAAIGIAAAAIFVVWLFHIFMHGGRPAFWPLIVALVVGVLTKPWTDPVRGWLRCPECRKPIFRKDCGTLFDRGRFWVGAGLLMPERECSACGYAIDGDLTR